MKQVKVKGMKSISRGIGNFRVQSLSLAALSLIAVSGCTVGPKYHAPVTQAPAAYKESPSQFSEPQQWQVAKPQDAMLRGKWWEVFNDPDLNALEEQLNINNQTIKQYFESFMEARAIVREARAQFFPTATIGPAWSRSKASRNLGGATGPSGTLGGQQTTIISAPLDVSWEPDLWGRIRNTVREQQYNAQVSAADLENQRLAEQASLASYYFEIRGQDALQKILNDTVEADRKYLQLAQARYETGVDQQLSYTEALTALQSAQSAATNAGLARAQYEHAIAVLIGQQAPNFSIPVKPMLVVPPPVPIGVPSQLVERRPDVAAAERNMAAANAAIGVAYAAYYPTVTLSASGGFQSSAWKHLFDWPSRFWSIGPTASETVYDGGLRRATVNQYIATYNANLAAYKQTVLTAFQQVEDSLAGVRILSNQIQEQQEAVNSAQTSLDLEISRYQTGLDPYLNVLTLQTTLLGDQQSLTSLQIQRMTSAVNLVEALGGGWDASQLPTPAQVAQKPSHADTTIQQ